ncbi:MAG: pyruvate formate lyase family protein, partial [Candidatus Thorarchaeota archaeon]
MNSRTSRLRDRMLNAQPTISSERARLFTEYVKNHEGEPTQLRMAKAFSFVMDNLTLGIEPEEIIVANMGPTPRSCQIFPEYSWTWISEELDRLNKRRTERFEIGNSDKQTLREVFEFWKGRSTAEIAREAMPEESQLASKAGLFTIGAPGTGIGHFIVDYERVLSEGLMAIAKEAADISEKTKDSKKQEFYEAVEIAIAGVIRFASRYADLAEQLAEETKDANRKEELKLVAETCRTVPAKPATSFYEALQSFWFIQLLVQIESNGHSISAGRFDQYLYPFYRNDIESGRINRERALELLEMLWIKFASVIKLRNEYYSVAFAGFPMFQNLTIGGQDEKGDDVCNDLTELILEAPGN